MNNSSSAACPDAFRPTIMDLPADLILWITVPSILFGMFTNLLVLVLLFSQKALSNQDMYVFVLCLSSFIMVGPCLATVIFRSWFVCPKTPRILTSLLIMGLQVTAGVNVWLTCCISIDRLLIVYHNVNYITKETKRRVTFKIMAIIVPHLLVGLFNNFVYYVPSLTSRLISPFEIPVPNSPSAITLTTAGVQEANMVLNVTRLATDRLVPWVLCPMTYFAVFLLRNRKKTAVQQFPMIGAASIGANEARIAAERRIRRSRKLVIGISVSVFVSLVPETVLDFANYALSKDLRTPAPAVGLIWYIPNIIDPLICIVSLTSLRVRTKKMLAKIGCRCSNSSNPSVTTGGSVHTSKKW